jgi:hypothetical protein
LLSSSASYTKRDNPADRKEAVAATELASSSSSPSSPVAVTRQQRTASIDYAKKREADALLPWTHKADTREVFEQRTPQQWKQEKVALEKRVLSPRLELNNSNSHNGTSTTAGSGDGGIISSHRRASQERREAEEHEHKAERDGRRDLELERERRELAEERRRMEGEWRELGAAKLRFSNEQNQAKRRLLDEWARVNEEKQKLAARYRELGEMLSRHNSTASTAATIKSNADDGLTAKRPS